MGSKERGSPTSPTSSDAPSLQAMQRWLKWAITDSGGVACALASRKGEPVPSCLESIAEAPPLSREERLDIYAEAYFERLVEVLEDDYAALKRVLGTDLFRALIVDYLEAHPSRDYSAAALGVKMPEFLQTHELSETLPYLPDLARLEWNVVHAFFAQDSEALSLEGLGSITEEQWLSAAFRLDRSVRLLQSRWNIDAVWKSKDQPVEEEERWLVIYRSNYKVRVESLTQVQYKMLEGLSEGLALDQLFTRLESMLDIEAEAPPLMQWFKAWIDDGIIRDIVLCR